MEYPNKYSDFLSYTHLPFFYHPWWLNAAAGAKHWGVAIAEENNQITGVWPFTFRTKLGLRLIRKPVFTPHLGPWLATTSSCSIQKNIRRQQKTLLNLINQLPNYFHVRVVAAPSFSYGLPLQWFGFHQTVHYFNQIALPKDLNLLFDSLGKSVRKQIRRSERIGQVKTSTEWEPLYTWQKAILKEQGVHLPFSKDQFGRIAEVLATYSDTEILYLESKSGKKLAGSLVVYDRDVAYSLAHAMAPSAEQKSAGKRVIWESIFRAHAKGCSYFHFGGSMREGIHFFNASFGGQPQTCYTFSKYGPSLVHNLTKSL